METKQTPVEYLLIEIENLTGLKIAEDEQIIEIAKEMEKYQAKEIWKASQENMYRQFSSSDYKPITFEQWYNSFKYIKNE